MGLHDFPRPHARFGIVCGHRWLRCGFALLFAGMGASADAKCPIYLFEIHGEAQAGDRIAFFVGDSAETSGFSGKHPQRAGADGRFRLQVQHSSTKSWSLGRCRFPDYGELLIVSDEGPWRRVRIELPRAALLSQNPVIVLPPDARACPQPETKSCASPCCSASE